MLSKERILAIVLAAGIVTVIVVPVAMGWIANLSEFATLFVSDGENRVPSPAYPVSLVVPPEDGP